MNKNLEKTEMLLRSWWSIMQKETGFHTFAVELAIVKDLPYNGRLGFYNPKTCTYTTPNGFVLYVTPDYKRRLMVMLNNLTKCDYGN